ncbi:hypothetical protein CFN78_01160 [Amycolatopsis antarctica]|uniref:Uncharacterized protein n=1 Tax=Amycolatopsis antarctica TaxID=1854586 RepID=A0A263D8L1_9PSEU|nr:hypothetical protein [Amycolatopsis antarctica]OZM74854.1 hypothetical protein CFN78_01160 [Amycolatopsis antarctica]
MNTTRLRWAAGIAVVVAGAGTVAVVTHQPEHGAGPTATQSRPARPPEPPLADPSIAPVLCSTDHPAEQCFPHIEPGALTAAAKRTGASCAAPDGRSVTCETAAAETVRVSIVVATAVTAPARVTGLVVRTFSGGREAAPQAPARAVERLHGVLETLLPPAFPKGPVLAAKIATWFRSAMGRCSPSLATHQVIGTYELHCQNPRPLTVTGEHGRYTNYDTSVRIEAPSRGRTG